MQSPVTLYTIGRNVMQRSLYTGVTRSTTMSQSETGRLYNNQRDSFYGGGLTLVARGVPLTGGHACTQKRLLKAPGKHGACDTVKFGLEQSCALHLWTPFGYYEWLWITASTYSHDVYIHATFRLTEEVCLYGAVCFCNLNVCVVTLLYWCYVCFERQCK